MIFNFFVFEMCSEGLVFCRLCQELYGSLCFSMLDDIGMRESSFLEKRC